MLIKNRKNAQSGPGSRPGLIASTLQQGLRLSGRGLLYLSLAGASNLVWASDLEQEQWLQERLFASQAARRTDLVSDARQRLSMIAPEHPEIIVLELQDALEQHDREEQKRLLELASRSGNIALQQRLAALERLAQPNGQMVLQQARLLTAAGQYDAAVKEYQSLFANEPPSFELALEYWGAVSSIQSRRTEAMEQLYRLNQLYPGNSQLQLLIGQLFLSDNKPDEALKALHEIKGGNQADYEKAAELEYNHLTHMPVSSGSVVALNSFLRRYPDSFFSSAARKNLTAQQKLLNDPNWQSGSRGRALLEQQRYAEAEPLLKKAVRAFPADGDLHGALAHALLNLDRYEEAEKYFSLAVSKIAHTLSERSMEPDIPIVESEASAWLAKWESLRLYNQSLIQIQYGDAFQQRGNYLSAHNAFLKAQKLQPNEVTSYLRLHELELAASNEMAALGWLQKAQRQQPYDDRVIYAAVGYYRERNPELARATLANLPSHMYAKFADLRLRLVQEQLAQEIEEALAQGNTARAIELQRRSLSYTPGDPWVAYRLASLLVDTGQIEQADQVFTGMLQRTDDIPVARYAHGIYLVNQDRDSEALDTLNHVQRSDWTEDIRGLHERLSRRQRLQEADRLFLAGQHEQAIQLVLQDAEAEQYAVAAGWYQEIGQTSQAAKHYEQALKMEPGYPQALVGLAEIHLAEGKQESAAELLRQVKVGAETNPYVVRRVAEAWTELGDTEQAIALYEQLLVQEGDDPHTYRNMARLYRQTEPERALDYYARGLAASNLLDPNKVSPLALPELTAATRISEDDDWLVRSLKNDTDELYRKRNTSIQIQQDFGWRSDSDAKGLSDLKRHTTIFRLDTPVGDGTGFVQTEHVRLDAGTPGDYRFGLCSKVQEQCRPGSQNANGTGIAVGWLGDSWSWDLGHSPFGFKEKNWLGGVTYKSGWRQLGYNLTLSRRPMSNSVVSYAGAVDPVSGTQWGGVTANGVTLGLSYDQGGAGGVWANFGAHKLLGTHVQDNQRLSAMTGYYHRLIDRVDERMRVGLTLMHWQYSKGMDEFTLGQGGYYSPQKYFSVGVPFSYAWRNYNWSVAFETSVSWSTSSYAGGDRLYISDSDYRIVQAGYTPNNGDLYNDSTSANGLGVRMRLMAERRLSDHWVVGSGIDWGYSKDYSPSHAFMYLRYVFKPWRGNLALPVEPLEPYSEWR